MRTLYRTLWVTAVVFFLTLASVPADEGLWLFDQPPQQRLKDNYDFELTKSLQERLQKASLLVGKGGSGSFVSAEGLVLTNHHVGLEWLQELSADGPDLVKEGFYAPTNEKEKRCPGLEVRYLASMEDVTARVQAAVKPDMTLAQAGKARAAALRAIEKESRLKTGLTSEVEALFHGGRYHLYRYKVFRDVRLVFAPEQNLGTVFDVCFLRAYENGKPAKVVHHLSWCGTPPEQGDLMLASGYPGSTNRFRTTADLEDTYGQRLLLNFKVLGRWEAVLSEFGKDDPEKEKQARLEKFYLNNEISSIWNFMGNLEKLLAMKRVEEKEEFARLLAKDEKLAAQYRQVLARIAACFQGDPGLYPSYCFLEKPAAAFNSDLFTFARDLVRLADEAPKADADRLIEYSGADRQDKRRNLVTVKTISKEMEIAKLADSLDLFVSRGGADAELAAKILDGKTPEECARALVEGSGLDQLETRKTLLHGGRKALAECQDTLIVLARLVDSRARQVRKQYEEKVTETCLQAYADLTRLREQVQKEKEIYPDATGTLRLSFGKVQAGHGMNTSVASIGDLFSHVKKTHQEERLPKKWQAAQDLLDVQLPVIFTSSADLVPGSSGSPVVDRQGRVMGVASFASSGGFELAYIEGESSNGAIAACGILEVLDKVYKAEALVKELGGTLTPRKAYGCPPPQGTMWPPNPGRGFGPDLPSGSPPLPSPIPVSGASGLPQLVGPPAGPSDFTPFHPPLAPSSPPPYHPDPEARGLPRIPTMADMINVLPASTMTSVATTTPRPTVAKKDMVPALIKALGDDDQEVADTAVTILAKLGDVALPALIEALEAKEWALRAQAATALGKMGPAAQEAIPALLKALEDQIPVVRQRAARALAAVIQDRD